MDNYNTFTKVSDTIEYSDICLTSFPCQHYVKNDGTRSLMGAINIYKLLQEKNITIPEHFLYCKEVLLGYEIDEHIKECNIEKLKTYTKMEFSACNNPMYYIPYKRFSTEKIMELVLYLMSERNIKVKNEQLVAACTAGNLELLKFFMLKNDPDPGNKITYYVGNGGSSLLSIAAYNGAVNIVKYLIEECKYSVIDGDKRCSPLRNALINKNTELCMYLLNKSCESKIQYDEDEFDEATRFGDMKIIKFMIENKMVQNKRYSINKAKRAIKLNPDSEIYKYFMSVY